MPRSMVGLLAAAATAMAALVAYAHGNLAWVTIAIAAAAAGLAAFAAAPPISSQLALPPAAPLFKKNLYYLHFCNSSQVHS